jgi:hypothetical protein
MPEKTVRVVIYVPQSTHNWILKHFCEKIVKPYGDPIMIGKTPSQAYLDLISLALQALEEGDEGSG